MKLRIASLASALILGGGLFSSAQAAMTCQTAVPLDGLAASFGMNTHMQQGWQYDDAATTVTMLKELGTLEIREPFVGLGHPGQEYAARQGIRFVFIIQGGEIADIVRRLEDWELRYPGTLIAIEGPNEVNNWPVTFNGQTGIPGAQAFQSALYDGVHASQILRKIPVMALTSWPVFHNRSDIGNIHAYSRGGGFMSEEIDSAIRDEETLNPPVKPIWMTEAGYHTHMGEDYNEGVSEDVQAKMATTMFLSAFARGIQKTFYYQLANQYTDPNDQQSYFGLVDQKWAPKPAYNALKSMITIVREAAGKTPGTPGSLRYALDGMPATSQQKAFRAGDGSWLIAVWNEPRIWDRANNVETAVEPTEVTLRFPAPQAKIALFDPLKGTTSTQSVENAGELAFPLGASPVLVRVEPGAGDASASECPAGTN